jgi:hypothetical protein
MSRSNCSLYVDANGRYCCVEKVFRITEHPYTVVLANTGPVDLLVFPTGDTDEVATVHSTLAEGSTTILDAGTYKLDLDCDALDGTDAPADVELQMAACCEPFEVDLAQAATLAKLCEMVELLGMSQDATALAEIISQLSALCDKLLAITAADAASSAAMLACLEDLKELNTCTARANLGAGVGFDGLPTLN